MIPADPTAELFADQSALLRRLVADAIATHPVAEGALDLANGIGDAESFLHNSAMLAALCEHALTFHAAGEHGAALAWGKAAYVANRRFAHAWLEFLDIAIGAGAIAQTGLVTPNPHPSFLERLMRPKNIPPTIMQYCDTAQPPDDVAASIEGWAGQSPKYTHRLCDDTKTRAFLAIHCDERVQAAYDSAPHVASRSDIFRLAWLVHNGGISVDANEQLTGDLDALLPPDSGLILNWSTGSPPCVNNWFIAARPRHPVVMAQLRLAVSHILDDHGVEPRRPVWVLSGPGVMSMALLDRLCFLASGSVLADVVMHSEEAYRAVVGFRDNAADARRSVNHGRSGHGFQRIDTQGISYLKLPLDEPVTIESAFANWHGFVQLHPEELPAGPHQIYELDDRQAGNWSHDFHWKHPAGKVEAIGCNFVSDIELWAPSIALRGGHLIGYGVDADWDNWRVTPGRKHDGGFDIPAPVDRVIDRPALIADGWNHATWGHWIVDYLPRFAIARDLLGARFDECVIPLPLHIPGWCIALLESACSVRPSNIIRYNSFGERLICARAIVPSYSYSKTYTFHSFIHRFYHRLRPQSGKPQIKLCVSRGGSAVASSNRRFPMRERFEDMARDRGYQVVRPETLRLSDQIKLFASASVVVGEHGSGMHNAVFCDPGTIVGCIGFWNPIQLHLGYICEHRNVYLTRGCVWPTEEQPEFQLAVTEEGLVSFLDKIDELHAGAATLMLPPDMAAFEVPTSTELPITAALPVDLEIITHVQWDGDVVATAGSWAAGKQITHLIEGFSVSPNDAIKPADLTYRATLSDGSISPWVSSGEFCGTRGRSQPLVGFQIQLRGTAAARYDCVFGAVFADQTRLEPSLAEGMRIAPSGSPMTAIWIELQPKKSGLTSYSGTADIID